MTLSCVGCDHADTCDWTMKAFEPLGEEYKEVEQKGKAIREFRKKCKEGQ